MICYEEDCPEREEGGFCNEVEFCKKTLAEHDQKVRTEVIEELLERLKDKYACFRSESNYWCGQECDMCDYGAVRVSDIEKIAEQLKEQKNEEL